MEENIRIDHEQIRNDKQKNFQERIWFIERWVGKMKEISDYEWSKGQADFIDAQFEMAERIRQNMEKTEEGREAMKRVIEWRKTR